MSRISHHSNIGQQWFIHRNQDFSKRRQICVARLIHHAGTSTRIACSILKQQQQQQQLKAGYQHQQHQRRSISNNLRKGRYNPQRVGYGRIKRRGHEHFNYFENKKLKTSHSSKPVTYAFSERTTFLALIGGPPVVAVVFYVFSST